MDESVRLACAQLTGSIVQDLAGQLSETATKLRAFLDVYPGAPTDIVREKLAELAPDKLHNMARQSFLLPERLMVKRYTFDWLTYTLPMRCNELEIGTTHAFTTVINTHIVCLLLIE